MKTPTTATFNGLTKSLSEWARLTGVPATRIYTRLCLGWTIKDAIFTPPNMPRRAAKDAWINPAAVTGEPKQPAPTQPAPEGDATAQNPGVCLDLQRCEGTGGGSSTQDIHKMESDNQEDAA